MFTHNIVFKGSNRNKKTNIIQTLIRKRWFCALMKEVKIRFCLQCTCNIVAWGSDRTHNTCFYVYNVKKYIYDQTERLSSVYVVRKRWFYAFKERIADIFCML